MSVFSENFARLTEHRERLNRLQTGLWHEAALFSDLDFPAPDEIGGIYEEICGNNESCMNLPDFARFCSVFSEAFRGRLGEVFADIDSDPSGLPPKIAYLQNTFSDKAYRIFSEDFGQTKPLMQVTAAYFPGFHEVCRIWLRS